MNSKPFRTVKNSFNTNTSKIRQIFCFHKWESHMEIEPRANLRCIYEKCEKCGKFKNIEYYKW